MLNLTNLEMNHALKEKHFYPHKTNLGILTTFIDVSTSALLANFHLSHAVLDLQHT